MEIRGTTIILAMGLAPHAVSVGRFARYWCACAHGFPRLTPVGYGMSPVSQAVGELDWIGEM